LPISIPYIFLELRAWQAAANRRKEVVGNMGTTIPIRPMTTFKVPTIKSISRIGLEHDLAPSSPLADIVGWGCGLP
jgi:hypothetical protein